MAKYTYYVIEDDPKFEDPMVLETEWGNFNSKDDYKLDEYELEYLAKKCAKHFYIQREAYKDERWPLTFAIEDNKGNRIGKVVVGMEYEPTFRATALES